MRSVLIALVLLAALPAVAQAHASSSTGYLAVLLGDERSSALQIVAPDGTAGPVEPLDDAVYPFAGVGPRGDAVVAYADREGLKVRYRPPGGPLEPPVLIAPGTGVGETMPLGIDAAGNVIVGYTAEDDPGDGGMRVRIRDATGAWLPEQDLGGINAFRPTLAIADSGAAVLSWRQGRGHTNDTQIAVATRAPGGGGFGPPGILAGVQRNASSPVTATNERGDAVVAWIERHREQPATRWDDGTAFSVHGAFRAGTGPFGRPVRLSRVEAASPAVAVQPTGRMVLAWTDNSERIVEARIRSTSGRLLPPKRLSADLQENSDVVALAAGRGAVAWLDRDPGVSFFRLAQATDPGGFGPPQLLGRLRGWVDEPPAIYPTPGGLLMDARRGDGPFRVKRVTLR